MRYSILLGLVSLISSVPILPSANNTPGLLQINNKKTVASRSASEVNDKKGEKSPTKVKGGKISKAVLKHGPQILDTSAAIRG